MRKPKLLLTLLFSIIAISSLFISDNHEQSLINFLVFAGIAFAIAISIK